MNKSRWDQYGESEFPEKFWQLKLEEYLITSNYDELELAPKLISFEGEEIVFKLSGIQDVYRIEKSRCKRHLPAITTDTILLTRHNIEIPFKEKKISLEVYSEVENEETINEILSNIIKNNPHWSSNILSDKQLAENIFHVLSYYFDRVNM